MSARTLTNLATGLDIHVSAFTEIPQTHGYIIKLDISTNLCYFKPSSCSSSTMVDFTVFRTLEEIETLLKILTARFPSVPLPSLQGIQSKSNTDQVALLKTVMDTVAQSPKLSTAVAMLSFLGYKGAVKLSTSSEIPKQNSDVLFDDVGIPSELSNSPKTHSKLDGDEDIIVGEMYPPWESVSNQESAVECGNDLVLTQSPLRVTVFDDDILSESVPSSRLPQSSAMAGSPQNPVRVGVEGFLASADPRDDMSSTSSIYDIKAELESQVAVMTEADILNYITALGSNNDEDVLSFLN